MGTNLDLDAWCPGNLPRLDAYVGDLKEVFGAPDDLMLDYYLVEEPVTSHSPCQSHAVACQVEGDVFSPWLPHDHEVAHAIGSVRGGFFEEGRVSYFGDAYPGDWASMKGLDVRAFIEDWDHAAPTGRYRLAAHFTAYLVHNHGLAKYVALTDLSGRDESRADFERDFERSMGIALDAAIDDYEATWPVECGPDSPRMWHYECGREPVRNIPGESVVFELEMSCNDPDALGPRPGRDEVFPQLSGSPRIWRDITIEHDGTPGQVVFEAPEPGTSTNVLVQFTPCSTDCAVIDAYTHYLIPAIWAWSGHPIEGPPMRYVMRVSAEADAGEVVRLRWET